MILSPLLRIVHVACNAEGILGRHEEKSLIKKKSIERTFFSYQRRPKRCVRGWVVWLYAWERKRETETKNIVSEIFPLSPIMSGDKKETDNIPGDLWATFCLWVRISNRTLFILYMVRGHMISYNIKHLIFSNVDIVSTLFILITTKKLKESP